MVASTSVVTRNALLKVRTTTTVLDISTVPATATVQGTTTVDSVSTEYASGRTLTETSTRTDTVQGSTVTGTTVQVVTVTKTPATRTIHTTSTSYLWPSVEIQKRAFFGQTFQPFPSYRPIPNPKHVLSATPAALMRYNATDVLGACARVVVASTETTSVPGPTKTSVHKLYTTLTSTTTIETTRTTHTRTTATGATLTQLSPTTAVSTTTSQLPDSTNTLVMTELSTVFGKTITKTSTKTETVTLPTTRTTLTLQPTATLQPVPFNYSGIVYPNNADRLPDFSFAGYHASNDPLPAAGQPPNITLQPSGDSSDRTLDIQNAIDQCGKGGVVMLAAGEYYVNGSLTITKSNCILRGELPTSGDPVVQLIMTGPSRNLISVGPATHKTADFKYSTPISDDYVPVGATSFNVADPKRFAVGDSIAVIRTVSQTWVAYMGMDKLVRNGDEQTWIRPGTWMFQWRLIAAIQNSTVTIDVPLTDAVNATMGDAGQIRSYTHASQTAEVGLENLWIRATPDQTALPINNGTSQAIVFTQWTMDSWIRNVVIQGFNNGITLNPLVFRVTVANASFRRDLRSDTSKGSATDINLSAQQVLVVNSNTQNRNGSTTFQTTTMANTPGPNVVLNHWTVGMVLSQPHLRWATGFLLDNSQVYASSFGNRGTSGSGHGWAIGSGVNWNVIASGGFDIQRPPIAQNFCIGCVGPILSRSTGALDAHDLGVFPRSLFLSQLEARLGQARSQDVTNW